MQRSQRTAASGVHHAIGAAQVEAVGYAAGHHVAKQPGERAFLPGHIVFLHAGNYCFGIGAGYAEFGQGLAPFGMAQARAQRDNQFQRAGNAEDDAYAAAVELAARAVAGVFQRHLGGQQAQQLGAVGGFQRVGRQAEFGRVEIHGEDESAAAGVGAVRAFGVLVEIIFRQPVGGWNFGDGVHAVLYVGPEAAGVLGFGKKAAYAYNGNG